MKTLLQKIQTKTATVGVIGLGYVGLPLAVEKAKAGFYVTGFDIQPQKVSLVNRGENYIGDIIPQELKDLVASGHLKATSDFEDIGKCDVIAICVPTPLDVFKQPDLSFVVSSAQSVADHLHKEMLVVLESTTYPGTTEEVLLPLFEEKGLKVGKDFYLAFSPERVDPGNHLYKTKNTPKVVGGCTDACTQHAKALYEAVLNAPVFAVSSPKEAEMTKILENTFRIVNCALANEMALVCNRMGINVWEVINAAATKPFGFVPFYPGPGVGGHCIPIDTLGISINVINSFIHGVVIGKLPCFNFIHGDSANSYRSLFSENSNAALKVFGVGKGSDIYRAKSTTSEFDIHNYSVFCFNTPRKSRTEGAHLFYRAAHPLNHIHIMSGLV
jgi:UDP-N-acetyl-D-glucosamine dehydrogenase